MNDAGSQIYLISPRSRVLPLSYYLLQEREKERVRMARKRERKAATQRSDAIPWALLDELEGNFKLYSLSSNYPLSTSICLLCIPPTTILVEIFVILF